MSNEIDALIALSRAVGADPTRVLAGGGNTSVKSDDRLWVKASGTALATCDADGFVELHRQPLFDLLDAELPDSTDDREAMYKAAALAARLYPERNQRPSVEAVLHNLLPGKFVVHTHPTLVNMLTCCCEGEAISRELFGSDVVWVPFTDPGLLLTRAVRDALAEFQKTTGKQEPLAILMESHGLILSGETAADAEKRTQQVLTAIQKKLNTLEVDEPFGVVTMLADADVASVVSQIAPALRGVLAGTTDEVPTSLPVVMFEDSNVAQLFAGGGDVDAFIENGALNPDQIVYCKRRAMLFDPIVGEPVDAMIARLQSAADAYVERCGFLPKIVIVRGVGLFGVGESPKSAATAVAVFTDAISVMAGAVSLGSVRHLPDRDAEFIENWEVESYRRAVAASGSTGAMENKVCLVTGAAQGFGLEIAQGLVAAGGHVVLADLNGDGAAAAARALCTTFGPGRAIGLPMDVTNEESVAETVSLMTRIYGGLDVLVSNAGVLKAAPCKEQPLADFEFVTKVNYTGYFLAVRAVATTMSIQNRARKSVLADIVQINSKSGLVGSNRNAAYAGSKFGGIGLTQSFALELIEDGVKVNSICPGNFYDGPLWSDPEKGLFVQYLQAGKVPGANTVADVRAHYESKSPIHRGCETADVLKAVFYLVAQQYETGQALPVTGGQVMLN